MASVNGDGDMQVRVVSRRLVKASDASIKPQVLALSNLDLLSQSIQLSTFCIYRKPTSTGGGGGFDAVVAAFESALPSFLNHFFPFAGRIATDPASGLPELRCGNQGAELVVGDAGGVALASLDYGSRGALARRVLLPYGDDVALSVQVASFACGGFTVAWRTHHVLADGKSMSHLVSAWSELARTGALAVESRPSHDRSVFRPRAPPAYDAAALGEAFTPLDSRYQINVLTASQSFVERLYRVEASDVERLRRAASRDGGQRASRVQALSAYLWKALAGVVAGTAETRCRVGFWVDGRRRIGSPERAAAMRNYVGNFITYAVKEASVGDVLGMPLPDVAAMVREAITAPAYEERFQEVVDWVEDHKTQSYVQTAILGLGSPILSLTTVSSFGTDTDFGFGQAAMAVPVATATARLCSGYVQVFSRPGDEGTWFVNMIVWPQLAAALEADEPRVLRPVTPEYLGLSFDSQVQRC
ncbi:unnamed protein product [Urochloa decumbens]|uniref:Uncharacterized protein n=1 Tax=Urochloa decumbens TaxID=240449 RepID=A0ABC8ZMP2_9POAL